MQLNWLYFCGICQMMPLKLWPYRALGCNHQSICMPQLQSLCSAALVPNVLPRRDEGSGKPYAVIEVLWEEFSRLLDFTLQLQLQLQRHDSTRHDTTQHDTTQCDTILQYIPSMFFFKTFLYSMISSEYFNNGAWFLVRSVLNVKVLVRFTNKYN